MHCWLCKATAVFAPVILLILYVLLVVCFTVIDRRNYLFPFTMHRCACSAYISTTVVINSPLRVCRESNENNGWWLWVVSTIQPSTSSVSAQQAARIGSCFARAVRLLAFNHCISDTNRCCHLPNQAAAVSVNVGFCRQFPPLE